MENADSDPTFPVSNLLCQESESSLDEKESEDYQSDEEKEADDEHMQLLLDREIGIFDPKKFESSSVMKSDWIQRARLEAIQWIFNARESFGFGYKTVYLSVIYLDRFLSRRLIDGEKHWTIRLLSVACLSLAAKVEEFKVPSLSDFPMEDYYFENKVIQRMELLISGTLEWRMSSVTPFAFIHYFISKFCTDPNPENILPTANELISSTIGDMVLMNNRASVIAAAATLLSIDKKLTRDDLELKINNVFLRGLLEVEDVFVCYNRIQELNVEETTPECIKTPASSLAQLGTSTSSVNNKRKRLIFHDEYQDQGISDEKPQDTEGKSDCSNFTRM